MPRLRERFDAGLPWTPGLVRPAVSGRNQSFTRVCAGGDRVTASPRPTAQAIQCEGATAAALTSSAMSH